MLLRSHIVDMQWIKENLDHEKLIIADCRFHLTEPEKGYEEYKQEHISGAVYFHLENDLSAPPGKHGGRHPLPDAEQFSSVMGKAGIQHDSIIVAYDDQSGGMASHLWWLLKYYGHEEVYVMREGFSHWKAAGYPVDNEMPALKETSYTAEPDSGMLASMEDVRKALHDPEVRLIDSRAEERFFGISEPFDPVAGHIPSAEQEDWLNRSDEEGRLKDKNTWEKEMQPYAGGEEEIIVYCGSGVTACVNVLALAETGRKAKLYAGSWSDWISYADNPVSRKK
jgi:thiosulfate/3-mercaptopyruvate sulfurtransferase